MKEEEVNSGNIFGFLKESALRLRGGEEPIESFKVGALPKTSWGKKKTTWEEVKQK